MVALISYALSLFLNMKKSHLLSFGFLLLFTVLSASISRYLNFSLVLIGVAIVKCLIVAFEYMELKHAHVFWKVLLPFTLLVYALAIWVV